MDATRNVRLSTVTLTARSLSRRNRTAKGPVIQRLNPRLVRPDSAPVDVANRVMHDVRIGQGGSARRRQTRSSQRAPCAQPLLTAKYCDKIDTRGGLAGVKVSLERMS